jgi:hypothetical protein
LQKSTTRLAPPRSAFQESGLFGQKRKQKKKKHVVVHTASSQQKKIEKEKL